MRLVRSLGQRLQHHHLSCTRQLATAGSNSLRRTALYDIHVKAGGKLVEFGGFEMPVQYVSQSIGESVLWTRDKASLFDVVLLCRG
jgi:Aminomethyltransferase folate-binding domain